MTCVACGHGRVHHFGSRWPDNVEVNDHRCWVYVRNKRPPHGCPCKGWQGQKR